MARALKWIAIIVGALVVVGVVSAADRIDRGFMIVIAGLAYLGYFVTDASKRQSARLDQLSRQLDALRSTVESRAQN